MKMTPRRRWLALLDGKSTDRIPCDYQATKEVTSRLLRDLDCQNEEALWRRLDIDARRIVEPQPIAPDDTNSRHTLGVDIWGIGYRAVEYGTRDGNEGSDDTTLGQGAYEEPIAHPLARAENVADVHAHAWPNPEDFDYDTIRFQLDADNGTRPIHAGCYEPFLLYGHLRGLQRSFEDLALRPQIADAILGHIFDFYYEHHRRIFDAARDTAGKCRIDLTWIAEDLGSQTGPLMSLAMYRRFLLPNQIEMADLARSFGVHVMYHTDGAARLFLPDLVDRVGIEILNPIQWRCPGMDRRRLVADFGDRVIFHGSIDNQQTLAFGSVDDVAREVRESVDIYRSARWICGPCHNIQPVSPTKNIVAMYETLHELDIV